MAQAPNYYFQSPWIADAARNLASALAPPDPEKQLANQRAQWVFERQQELALIEDQKRKDAQDAESAYAEMLRPVTNPLTGAVDQQLTNEKIMKKWAEAIELGGDPGIGESLSGELNPEVAVKRAMMKLKAAEAMGLSGFNWSQRGGLQDDAQAHDSAEKEKQRRFQADQNAARLAAYLKRGRGQGGAAGPNEIPDAIIKTISYGLDDRIAATGRDMTLEDYFRFGEEAGKRWQENGNVDQALNEQWAESFANSRTFTDAEHEPDTPGLFGGSKGKLKPYFADRPTNLGEAATQTPAPPAAPVTRTQPAAAPTPAPTPAKPPTKTVTSKTPPVKALKEDIVTTFKNGEKWTLKNGVPTKVN